MSDDLEARIKANASDETACVLCGATLSTGGGECAHCFPGPEEDFAQADRSAVVSLVKRARGLLCFGLWLAPVAWHLATKARSRFQREDLSDPWIESQIETTRLAAGLVSAIILLLLLVPLWLLVFG